MSLSFSLRATIERRPLARKFTISRGTKTEAVAVTVEIGDGEHVGRGECVPYARYGETPAGVLASIDAKKDAFMRGLDRVRLQRMMPAGAARNALDCALWDLDAKRSGRAVCQLAGLPLLKPLLTAFTISLDTPQAMAQAAAKAADWPLLKIKLGGDGDAARLAAIRRAAPQAVLIVDANEGWRPENLAVNIAACEKTGVALIEQPLPQAMDAALAGIPHPVPVCADESVHDRASLAGLAKKYEAVNIKLDKAGGLTEALAMTEAALSMGLFIMAGCMVASSLAIAPSLLFAQKAQFVDLDGPLWLAKDRPHGLRYENHHVYPAAAELWG